MKTVLDVAEDGFCSGCGSCAFQAPSVLEMVIGSNGHYQPRLKKEAGPNPRLPSIATCPMSGFGPNETELAERLWPDLPVDDQIGRYRATIATHLTDTEDRLSSGSGGIVTWLAEELLSTGEVDCVIHVRPFGGDDGGAANQVDQVALNGLGSPLFLYQVSRNRDDIRDGKKSRYYPVEMSRVLSELMTSQDRAVIIGVPCFIKSLRGLIEAGALPADRVPFMIGLVCGHLKSIYFAEYLAWQRGVAPGELSWCDFRHKLMDRPASSYGFAMRSRGAADDAPAQVIPMEDLRGRDWGEGLFRLPACEFCDDVLAECADVAVGDAWLPEFVGDPLGENVVVVRNARIAELIAAGQARGAVSVTEVAPAKIAQSQASGLRHRREGLAHRLARGQMAGKWIPRKRVAPNLAPTAERQAIYDLRQEIAETSNASFARARKTGSIDVFEKDMAVRRRRLKRLSYGTLMTRVLRRLRKMTQKALRLSR